METKTNYSLPDSSYWLFVCLKLDRLVHVWLPIFDKAIVISRHHPTVIVRPNHRTNRYCVGLRISYILITVLVKWYLSWYLSKLTWRIVSKLNVKPFQRVNSPELAPVISRRPSGVHAKQKMGHRILFVAVLTNFDVMALLGLSK